MLDTSNLTFSSLFQVKVHWFLAAIAALYLGSSLVGWLTGAKLGQSYTTMGRPHIEAWRLHKDIKDINDNDNNDSNDNNNNKKDDNDNNKDPNDN